MTPKALSREQFLPVKVTLPWHIAWFGNDRRKMFYCDNAEELKMLMEMKHKIDLPNGDCIYLVPNRVRHYMTEKEAIIKDQELWRKLNN